MPSSSSHLPSSGEALPSSGEALPSPSEQGASRNDDVLIKVENVSKKFCRDFKKSLWYGVKDTAADIFSIGQSSAPHSQLPSSNSELQTPNLPALRPGEFWGNQGISFEVKRGECLGLIGHNGAGKTTLLKMLNGLMKPDTGSITMKGRIGALIALGAGFNPILTGRENVYVNGSILGLHKKEITAKLDEIIAFAEIDDAIDAPVRTYSSGMQVRLGFAVAAILIEPDVLILDEVLAVGDIGFTIKCLNAVKAMASKSAVLLVSHSMQTVSTFCDSAIHLGNGSIILGPTSPSKCINSYVEEFENPMVISGAGGASISNIRLNQDQQGETDNLSSAVVQGQSWALKFDLCIEPPNDSVDVNVYIMDESLLPIIQVPLVTSSGEKKAYKPGKHEVKLNMGLQDLNSGKYCLTIICARTDNRICLIRKQGCFHFSVSAAEHGWGQIVRPVKVPS